MEQYELADTLRSSKETAAKLGRLHKLSDQELRIFWEQTFEQHCFYHGTNSLAYDMIQKTGKLCPRTRIWDDDFLELEQLLIKAGNEHGFGTRREGKIFFTHALNNARSYAQASPETWSYFIGSNVWLRRDKTEAINMLQAMISREASMLSLEEKERARDIFEKYWKIFEPVKPVVLVFSPAIMDRLLVKPIFTDFHAFKEYIASNNDNYASTFTKGLDAGITEDSPVSLEYLVAVEE